MAKAKISYKETTKEKPPTVANILEEKPPTVANILDKIGIDTICEKVANCVFYEDIANECGVSRYSLMKWLNDNESMYAPARESRADKLVEDILKISDDGQNDTYIDENGNKRTDQDVIARSRLRVDSRKWLASKMLPKKYGDKIDVDAKIDGNLTVQIVKYGDNSTTE
mgnify:CR=1 FL=1